MTHWLDDLNPAQRQAVTAGGGPLLIVAGAGTGKTKTLACRVAYLIEQGVRPDRILLLTFTRRAAAEMITRAARMIAASNGQDKTAATVASRVWGGTFHAIANRLLRMYGRHIGLADAFTVMDESDAADLIQLVRNDLGVAKKERRFPRKQTLLAIYSRMVSAREPLDEVLTTRFPWCADDREAIGHIFDGYVDRKKKQQLLDYDDLLLFWRALCRAHGTGARVADRFEHVLVDEYQDTNTVQADILRAMRRRYDNICVVGDDAQSIYSFRAATVRNILDFPQHFPDARIVTLEQNYRSTEPILAASNAVMEPARERYTKNLWSKRPAVQKPVLTTCRDEAQQTDAVCRNILDHLERGIPLMRQAVLFRAGYHSAHLEIELTRRNMPFHKFGGLKFVETAHIKDAVAVLRVLENPFDEIGWHRILLHLPGIGPKTARRIMDALGIRPGEGAPTQPDDTLSTPLTRLLAAPPAVPPAAAEEFTALRELIRDCTGTQLAENARGNGNDTPTGTQRRNSGPPLTAQIDRIRRFFEPIFQRVYENPAVRLRDVEQLAQIASGYRSRARFLTDLTLDPPRATSDLAQDPYLEEDYLTLSTIHSAKGCEWDVVHILHAADGMIPSDMAVGDEDGIEEERRLFYVAMTRARDALYIYHPLRYYHARFGQGDGHGFSQLTRFLPPNMHDLLERRAAGADDPTAPSLDDDTPADPYAGLTHLWRG